MLASSPQLAPNYEPQKKWGLVFSGGGFGAAYGLGVMQALQEDYHMPKPSIVVGSSASAPTACLYSTGQVQVAIDAWRDQVSNPSILQHGEGDMPKVDVEQVIAVVRSKLNLASLMGDDTRVCFVASDLDTGLPVILDAQKAESTAQFYDMMRASMALPGAYGKTVHINDGRYVDGDLSSSDAHKVNFVREQGIDDVVLVRSARIESAKELLKILKQCTEKDVYSMFRANYQRLLQTSQAVMVSPSAKIPCGLLKSNSREDIESTIDLGFMDAMRHFGLKKLATDFGM